MKSWSCISNSWFEIWWSRVQLFVFVQEALTGEKALLKGLLPLERFLSTNGSFCSSIYIKDSPKLPWGIMQRICGPPVFMTIIINHFAFWETLCPAPLVHYIFVFSYSSLYFYTSDTFRPILALFTHFTYANFSYVYYHAEYFSYPWWCCWSAKARNLILAVKGLTWTIIFYFLLLIVLNFNKI